MYNPLHADSDSAFELGEERKKLCRVAPAVNLTAKRTKTVPSIHLIDEFPIKKQEKKMKINDRKPRVKLLVVAINNLTSCRIYIAQLWSYLYLQRASNFVVLNYVLYGTL